MVKNTENKPAETSKMSVAPQVKSALSRVLFWGILLVIVYGMWRNPQIVKNMADFVSEQTSGNVAYKNRSAGEDQAAGRLIQLQNQVDRLQMQLEALSDENAGVSNLSRFESKFEAIEKQNLNVIDSKADVATVLGIITRLDKIEEKLDTLAKVSDDGALVLTAVMMVKESSENGADFVYEAEILQQLAKNDADIKNEVDVIAQYAREGVQSQTTLVREFSNIYHRLAKVKTRQEMEGKSWKEVLNIKLNEVVKVKRVNDVAAPQSEKQDENSLKHIYELVKNGDLRSALDNLHQLDNPVFAEDKDLQQWMAAAQAKINFNQAVADISAHSLALMKINTLKKHN